MIAGQFVLTDGQAGARFAKSNGKPRVDDRRVLNGIIFINRDGLHWRHMPAAHYATPDGNRLLTASFVPMIGKAS